MIANGVKGTVSGGTITATYDPVTGKFGRARIANLTMDIVWTYPPLPAPPPVIVKPPIVVTPPVIVIPPPVVVPPVPDVTPVPTGTLVGKIAGPTRFIKGVWTQVPATHADWKARGINTLVTTSIGNDFPGYGFTADQYHDSAEALGFKQMRDPRHEADGTYGAKAAADAANPNILAFNLLDEPNLTDIPAAVVQAQIDSLRAISATKPLALNLTMACAAGNWGAARYWNLAGIDWHGGDIYPDRDFRDGWPQQMQSGFTLGAGNWLSTVDGRGVYNIRSANYNPLVSPGPFGSAGKAAFAYIGTGHVGLGSGDNNPVGAQRPRTNRLQAWSAVINGASGIKVFASTVGVMRVTGSISGIVLTISAVSWKKFPNRIYYDGLGLRVSTNYRDDGTGQIGASVNARKIVRQLSEGVNGPGNVGTYELAGPLQDIASQDIAIISNATYGSSDDDSTPDNLTELATMFANIDLMERLGLLMDPVKGGCKPFDFWRSWDYWGGNADARMMDMPMPTAAGLPWDDSYSSANPWGENNLDARLNGPTMSRGFEARVMKGDDGRTYFLVLNLLDAQRSLTIVKPAMTVAQGGIGTVAGWSVKDLAFSRLEVKLFTDLSTVSLLGKAGVDD